MNRITVERIAVLAVGPNAERTTWSARLGEMLEALVIVRMDLSNGVEAISSLTMYMGHDFDRTADAATCLMAPFVRGKCIYDIPQIYSDARSRYVPLGSLATSLMDIAPHDGKAKTLGVPIYKMLGAARQKFRAYASSPLLPDDGTYIAYCHAMLAEGYRTIKIHPYCHFEDDLRLVKRWRWPAPSARNARSTVGVTH
ncbi:MAG: mandelate racemase/muconate lactonizing enzyme family protein [Pseudomonadota bacterium]